MALNYNTFIGKLSRKLEENPDTYFYFEDIAAILGVNGNDMHRSLNFVLAKYGIKKLSSSEAKARVGMPSPGRDGRSGCPMDRKCSVLWCYGWTINGEYACPLVVDGLSKTPNPDVWFENEQFYTRERLENMIGGKNIRPFPSRLYQWALPERSEAKGI